MAAVTPFAGTTFPSPVPAPFTAQVLPPSETCPVPAALHHAALPTLFCPIPPRIFSVHPQQLRGHSAMTQDLDPRGGPHGILRVSISEITLFCRLHFLHFSSYLGSLAGARNAGLAVVLPLSRGEASRKFFSFQVLLDSVSCV